MGPLSFNKTFKPLLWLQIACASTLLFLLLGYFGSTTKKQVSTSLIVDLHSANIHGIPMSGKGYEIYRPAVDMSFNHPSHYPGLPIISTPEQVMEEFRRRFTELDRISTWNGKDASIESRARLAYTELLAMVVSAKAFGRAERAVVMTPDRGVAVLDYNDALRTEGLDWTYLAMTMTGVKRLEAISTILHEIFTNKIPGAFMETGVWRGGSTIYARGIMRAYGESHRMVYVCDSFSGLPPGDTTYHIGDIGWDHVPFLEVSASLVQQNFEAVQLLDSSIVFVKGFFNETMPPLQSKISQLAVLRLDGDMYQSTVDVLYFMYEKLAIGGYVIVDDWVIIPARAACQDFLDVHGLEPEIIKIDDTSVYWKKTVDVPIQIERYYSRNFALHPATVSN